MIFGAKAQLNEETYNAADSFKEEINVILAKYHKYKKIMKFLIYLLIVSLLIGLITTLATH